MASGMVYITALIWNTQMKNVLKCSNISVKKYQKRPRFGVKSGTPNLKPMLINFYFIYMQLQHNMRRM